MNKAVILIVDDDPVSQEILADLLPKEIYHINMASDSDTLFSYLEESIPDVILLDVMMPKLDGYEICARLKGSSKWQHIPVVFVTALDNRKSMIKGLESGADDFLPKPVHGPELRARVKNMVRIKRQYDALQETAKLQKELVRIAAHDMRTPLASILLNNGSLLMKCRDEIQKERLTIIDVETRRLNRFIDDFLLLIRRNKADLGVKGTAVNLSRLVSEVIRENSFLANTANVQIETSFPPEFRTVNLDEGLFRRVVDNLLSNAIRRSPRGKKIFVSIRDGMDTAELPDDTPGQLPGHQGVILSFADQGSGILSEHREDIFEATEIRYFRELGVSGPSIGLALTKLIVDEHHGRISITNNQPTGSVFSVNL